MSSMRNAISRRPHKERAQPAARQKWGLLEKHKDYSLRAADYNTKKQKLSQLQRKARDRHPDEFAYGMVNANTGAQGKHGRGGNENRLSHDAVKLYKTQDAGYLRGVLATGRRETRRLEEMVMGGEEKKGRKIVFEDTVGEQEKGEVLGEVDVDDGEGADGMDGDVVGMDHSDGDAGKVVSVKPKSRKAQQAEKDAAARLKAQRKKRRKLGEMRTAKLELLKKRQKEIMAAADQLDLQRAKMARSVGGVNKDGVKFKIRERKR